MDLCCLLHRSSSLRSTNDIKGGFFHEIIIIIILNYSIKVSFLYLKCLIIAISIVLQILLNNKKRNVIIKKNDINLPQIRHRCRV